MHLLGKGYRAARVAAVSLSLLSAVPAPVVQAQTIEEIVVTARRVEETLQEVPLAVTAIPAEEIRVRGIKTIVGISQLDPSVIVDQGFNAEDTRIAVRGLTNTRGRTNVAFLVDGVDVTSEAVAAGGSSLLASQRLLTDVERIEVVKGPQSALYGRAAFAGAISYVTKDANLESVDSTVALELADNDHYQLNAGISGPVIQDVLALGVQVVSWDSGGFYENPVSGADFGATEGWGAAFTTNYEPRDTFMLKWRVSYSDNEVGPQPQYVYTGDDLVEVPIPPQAFETNGGPLPGPVPDGAVVLAPPTLGSAGDRRAYASENPVTGDEYLGSSLEVLRTSLRFDWDVGPGTFTSITGATRADILLAQDVDYQAINRPDEIPSNFETNSKNETKQLSQEFRYATNFDTSINFTLGALGWRERRDYLDRGHAVNCRVTLFDPLCATDGWQAVIRAANLEYGDTGYVDATTKHWSLYGLIQWDITELLTMSFEARYVDEDFEVARSVGGCIIVDSQDPCGPFYPAGIGGTEGVEGDVNSTFVTPKFLLEYQAADNAMLYMSAGKGQKPAGISTFGVGGPQTIEELSFDSEIMWAYEAGWKTSFDGDLGNLVFNGALFFQDYTDKQVATQIYDPIFGVSSKIENASSAEVLGQEVEFIYMPPVEGLSFTLAYTHLDTEYNDYVSTNRTPAAIAKVGNCVVVRTPVPTNLDQTSCVIDRTGNKLERAPEHALFATFNIDRPFFDTGWNYLIQMDANYQSERYITPENFTQLEDVWLANLRLGVQADNWSVIAFVNNVFDDDTMVSGGTTSPDFGAGFRIPPFIQTATQLPIPRQVGVRVNWAYGD
ncbi:MAG: TonB-dependent receptor [Gammaproteobacteria bacterium]|jgi:iron complex outermembrane receptor protein